MNDSIVFERKASTLLNGQHAASSYLKENIVVPRIKDIIFKSTGSYTSIDNKTIQGEAFITQNSLIFIPKQGTFNRMIEIQLSEINQIAKINRRGFEKGIEVLIDNQSIIFSSFSQRDLMASYIKIISEASKRKNKSFGFNNSDDAKVIKKISILRAPHVFEEVIEKNETVKEVMSLQDIFKLLKAPEFITEFYTIFNFKDAVVSNWLKNKDGLTRVVCYSQPMFQPLSVSSNQNIMSSDNTLAFDMVSKFSRIGESNAIVMNLQLLFKQEEEKITFREAYSTDYNIELYDKEFIESSVSRQNKILFHFIKSKLTNNEFNEENYADQWAKHQTYVLIIISLLVVLFIIIFYPQNNNWYGYLFGAFLFIMFFYFYSKTNI